MKRLMRTAGYDPGEVLAVGDEVRDFEAAKASGVHFIGVSWGYTAPAALQPYSDGPLLEKVEDLLDVALAR